jgi:multicomponent Na+:H+ antiporter subunit D
MRTGIYPPELKSINIDFDWTYRRLAPAVVAALTRVCGEVFALGERAGTVAASRLVALVRSHHGPQGVLARTWPTGSMVLWAVILLLAYLLLYYL